MKNKPLPKWPRHKKGIINTYSCDNYFQIKDRRNVVLQFCLALTDIRNARQIAKLLNQWADAAETRLR